MKRLTDIQPGDLLTVDGVQSLFPWLERKTLYTWKKKFEDEPESYPPCAKIGNTLVWSKRELVDFVNRQFAKMSA